MRVTCILEELDETLCTLLDSADIAEQVESGDETTRLVSFGYQIMFPALDIYVREGEMLYHDEETGDWETAFSVSIVYPAHSDEYAYWEEDSISVTLHNYLLALQKDITGLSQQTCLIELPDSG